MPRGGIRCTASSFGSHGRQKRSLPLRQSATPVVTIQASSPERWPAERRNSSSQLVSWEHHYLGGNVIMATTTGTGYCMKCKAQRGIKNAKQITMKNGRPATEGTCSVCSTKI